MKLLLAPSWFVALAMISTTAAAADNSDDVAALRKLGAKIDVDPSGTLRECGSVRLGF